jgi:hypothetical protein
MIDGDPDPISAGTAGDAALWGGSSAAVGMAANPLGAHQAGRHIAGRVIGWDVGRSLEQWKGAPGEMERQNSSSWRAP